LPGIEELPRYLGDDVGSHRGAQAAVQALTIAGVLSWWLIRASVLLAAFSIDLVARPAKRGLRAARRVDWDARTEQAIRYFMAFGATCGIFTLIGAAITAVVILTEPERPYPRITISGSGRNPGPILIEFGPR